MYDLRAYQVSDFHRMKLRKEDLDELMGVGEQVRELARYYMNGPGFTLTYNNKIVGCGGVINMWAGVGEAWFRGTPLIYEHRIKVLKVCKQVIQTVKANAYRRIQAAVRSDWAAAHRFVKYIGFKHEGFMPFYGPDGATFIRYAITDED